MFKISNTQKAILDLFGKRHEVVIQCNPNTTLNSIDGELAKELGLEAVKPRMTNKRDNLYPISNTEFTLEITSIEGETKRVTVIADISNHLNKNKRSILIGSSLLKEIEACIVI